MDASPGKKRSAAWSWGALALGMALSLLLFRQAIGFEFQSYDDHFFIRDNQRLQAGLNSESVRWALTANLFGVDREAEYWMPLTLLSRLVDTQLFGLDGGWHHLQGLLLHGLNAGLVFLLLRRATGHAGRSLLVGALFLVHPLMMEVVGWVALRKDVLTATFCLLTLLAYVEFAQSRRRAFYFLSLLAFAGALAAKPSSISFPLTLLLFDVWPLQRLGFRQPVSEIVSRLAEKVPFLLLSALIAGLTYVGQSDAGSAHAEFVYSLPQRLAATNLGFLEYLQRMLLPDQLCVLYPLQNPQSISAQSGLLAGVLLLTLTVLFVCLAWRGFPAGLIGWVWFLGLTLPVSGLVQFGRQSTADRYMYLPIIGIFVALVWMVGEWVARREGPSPSPAWRRWVPVAASLLVIGLFYAKATHQLAYWRSSAALWQQAANVVPDHVYALRMLGRELSTTGSERLGATYLRAAVKMAPERVDVQFSMGFDLAMKGRHAEALPYLERAIKLAPQQVALHRALVSTLRQLGRVQEARRAWVRLHLVRMDAFLRKGAEFAASGDAVIARQQYDLAWSAVSEARLEAGGVRLFREGTKLWQNLENEMVRFPLVPGRESDVPYVRACIRYLQVGAEVLPDFEKFTRDYPADADGWWRLALCQRERGAKEASELSAAEARRRSSEPSEASEEWRRIAERERLATTSAAPNS